MADPFVQPIEGDSPPLPASTVPSLLRLELPVSDPDSIAELVLRTEGSERNEYALGALRIGLLSLKHARGQIDADAVKHEGERLLKELEHTLERYKQQLNLNLTNSLKEYFDPTSGRFNERVQMLIKQDGELEQVLRRQIGLEGSELGRTLAAHVGEHSPLIKLLNPDESRGLVQTVRRSLEEALQEERERILIEFSLNNKEGALSRLINELSDENGKLKRDLEHKVDELVKEFSLDKEDSALSRLVKKVEATQQTIAKEFSLNEEESALSRMSKVLHRATEAIDNNLTLDKEESALARMRRELVDILENHAKKAAFFQESVKESLAKMTARREEALRSTAHGRQFEDVVWEFVQQEAQRAGDVPTRTGNTTGSIRWCKVGDYLVELGPDSAAASAKYVVEAKEDGSYDLAKAREEIQTGRQNREAEVGVFIFSRETAPTGMEPLLRRGDDVFVIWDAEDTQFDVHLKAALTLAKALCVRQAKARETGIADFTAIEAAIQEIEARSVRLEQIRTWTDTIKNNSDRILDEVRKMRDSLERQVEILKERIADLKQIVAEPR